MICSKATALSVAVTLLSATNVDAFWRMPCRSRTGLARIDPIMDPGMVSDHAHTIHGGGSELFICIYCQYHANHV